VRADGWTAGPYIPTQRRRRRAASPDAHVHFRCCTCASARHKPQPASPPPTSSPVAAVAACPAGSRVHACARRVACTPCEVVMAALDRPSTDPRPVTLTLTLTLTHHNCSHVLAHSRYADRSCLVCFWLLIVLTSIHHAHRHTCLYNAPDDAIAQGCNTTHLAGTKTACSLPQCPNAPMLKCSNPMTASLHTLTTLQGRDARFDPSSAIPIQVLDKFPLSATPFTSHSVYEPHTMSDKPMLVAHLPGSLSANLPRRLCRTSDPRNVDSGTSPSATDKNTPHVLPFPVSTTPCRPFGAGFSRCGLLSASPALSSQHVSSSQCYSEPCCS
jgi:hypothetical protein